MKVDISETLDNEFSALSEENKEKVLEMTKFLVFAQNDIIPEMLNFKNFGGWDMMDKK